MDAEANIKDTQKNQERNIIMMSKFVINVVMKLSITSVWGHTNEVGHVIEELTELLLRVMSLISGFMIIGTTCWVNTRTSFQEQSVSTEVCKSHQG